MAASAPRTVILYLLFSSALSASWLATGPFGGDADIVRALPQARGHVLAAARNGLIFSSTNGGASWHRFGIGFPHAEVYDITLQSKFRILRAATHGLGFWQAFLFEDL